MYICMLTETDKKTPPFYVFELTEEEYRNMIEQYQQDEYSAYIQNQDNKKLNEYAENKAPSA